MSRQLFACFSASCLLLGITACAPAVEPGPIDQGAPMAYTKTDSGLEYRILRKSDGKQPQATDKVTVHYKGWLEDETEFDSSYKRGQPVTFPLNAVIAGWTEGLQLMKKGAKFEFTIPSELAYGDRGNPRIPGNSVLVAMFYKVRNRHLPVVRGLSPGIEGRVK